MNADDLLETGERSQVEKQIVALRALPQSGNVQYLIDMLLQSIEEGRPSDDAFGGGQAPCSGFDQHRRRLPW